eukprot:scaffold388513_cov53-Prasinocladus_malaysianus.AAC.1
MSMYLNHSARRFFCALLGSCTFHAKPKPCDMPANPPQEPCNHSYSALEMQTSAKGGMVIVVPPLAESEESHQPVVSAEIP